MSFLTHLSVALVAFLHFGFMILEMFLWEKPIGLKIFRSTAEIAQQTATLAANQGLYNGFLAVGLCLSFFYSEANVSFHFRVFLLSCIMIAGIYGAWSVNTRILFLQTVPALIALVLVLKNQF